MSKKLTAQALDSLLKSQQSNISGKNVGGGGGSSSGNSGNNANNTKKSTVNKKKSKKSKSISSIDLLPKTKTGLKKIKHELRYGHSVKKAQEEKEARENPLDKLKSQAEKEQEITERNLNYYRATNRVSKKEMELRKKIKKLREKARGERITKLGAEKDESDGEDD
ncbi:hypothetical protein BGZ76_004280 [Entomortierella beljakovae]|nr:hypothetical protein BGZ76_004280 [Entomortierella beljakovae]